MNGRAASSSRRAPSRCSWIRRSAVGLAIALVPALTQTAGVGAPIAAILPAANQAAPPDARASNAPPADVDYAAAWAPLVQRQEFAKARALCEPWIALKNRKAVVEGHKCLANVELADARVRKPESLAPGEPVPSPRYEGPAVGRAIDHVNIALALAPEDLSIHLGRLLLLLRSGQLDKLAPALGESLRLYQGPDALEQWLGVASRMFESEQYDVALALFQALEHRYPDSHKIAENIGITLAHLQRDEDSLRYLERAVQLAPDDPLDNWNLGTAYLSRNMEEGAEVLFRKAISLQKDPEKLREWRCFLAGFIETRRGDRVTACAMQKKDCPPDQQTACAPPPLELPPPLSRVPPPIPDPIFPP